MVFYHHKTILSIIIHYPVIFIKLTKTLFQIFSDRVRFFFEMFFISNVCFFSIFMINYLGTYTTLTHGV